MRRGLWLLLLAACILGACSTEREPEVNTLTAELFDCRASGDPERVAETPLDCILDPACEASMITGHRGAGGPAALYAPENTIQAVRLGILLGLDVVEIDVRETSDDQLVIMHDADLSRTTGDDRKVSDLTLDEVTAIPIDATGFPGDFSCAKVPTFREVLDLAKGRINIDVDTKTNRADLVAAEIRDAGMIDQAFVSAGGEDKLVLARRTVPEIRLQARPDTRADYDSLMTRLDRPPEILEVPVTEIESFTALAEETGSKVFSDVFLEDVVAYGEGDTSAYVEAYERGADILQSEFPTFVLRALGRSYWSALPEHRQLEIGDSPLLP